MPPTQKTPSHDPFEDEINENPAAHFLSPVSMYEYDDWAADDSDDEGDQVEWDAGITDFALFQNDQRQARERHEQVPDRWDSLLASQRNALHRAVQRNRAVSEPSPSPMRTPLLADLPQLTPDNSPNLKDDFDIEAYCGQKARRQAIPDYLTLDVTPPDEETDEDDDDEMTDSDDDELPVAYLVERARERRRQARKMERPGMRFNRTMSGKTHVWRRPSYHIYAVDEDAEAERKAELANVHVQDHQRSSRTEDQHRGRRR